MRSRRLSKSLCDMGPFSTVQGRSINFKGCVEASLSLTLPEGFVR